MNHHQTDIASALRQYHTDHGCTDTRIAAALIDMDGVLYDSMPYHTLSWHRMMSEQGIDCTRDEFYLYEGMTGAATINMLFSNQRGVTLPDEEVKRLYRIKTEYFKTYPQPEPMPGAEMMFDTLKRAGIRRILVTGSAQNTLLTRLDRDYPGAFAPADRVTALDVTRGKPDPEPYLRALEKAGVAATQAIVVENAPLGVKAGHDAGCFTVGLTTGPVPAGDLREAGAHIVFSDMQQFADALRGCLNLTHS